MICFGYVIVNTLHKDDKNIIIIIIYLRYLFINYSGVPEESSA